MRRRPLSALAVIALLAAGTAFASSGDWPKPTPTPTGGPDTPQAEDQGDSPRKEAERFYGDAFDEVAKGRRELDAGHADKAQKLFRKARSHAENAVGLDPKFYEAWNLVGYSARKTGDYKSAFAAYDSCLALKPDYAPAREYVGEAYVEVGDLAHAREQLAWLEKLHAADDAKELGEAIDAATAKAGVDSTKAVAGSR